MITDIVNGQGLSILGFKTFDFGWIHRFQPEYDNGIDSHIEIVQEDNATGRLIAVQLKTGQSCLILNGKKDAYVYYIEERHYNYWLNHSLPVILVLCDEKKEICYWQHITEETVTPTDKKWKTEVPISNILDDAAKIQLERIAENQSEYEKRYHSLLLAKPFMVALNNGNDIILETDDLVNKSLGRGSFSLSINDNLNEKNFKWNYMHTGYGNYRDIVTKFFPWANIDIDDDFYYNYEEDEYKSSECHLDTRQTHEQVFRKKRAILC